MLKLLVLADDFTGALDTGVQFSNLGVKTEVRTSSQLDYQQLAADLEVLVIDTESRYLSFQDSYQLIYRLIEQAKITDIPYIYKKVDSALRGNISSEIKALADLYPEQGLTLIPAFPEFQRTVKNGKLYIEGDLVADSVFAKDPYEPVTESDIVKRIKEEADLDLTLLRPQDSLPADKLLLFDADSEQDLSTIAEKLAQDQRLKITVGCAGFAKDLAKQLFPKPILQTKSIDQPLAIICGSVNPITQRQVSYALEQGHHVHSLTGQQLLEEDYWLSPDGQSDVGTYLQNLTPDQLLIFETFSPSSSRGLASYCQDQQISAADMRFKIGQSLGSLAQQFLAKKIPRTLFFTGGDTLYQSMQVLGVTKIEPLYEVSPGVVLSQISWQGQSFQVLTKSGGFGHAQLFQDLHQLTNH